MRAAGTQTQQIYLMCFSFSFSDATAEASWECAEGCKPECDAPHRPINVEKRYAVLLVLSSMSLSLSASFFAFRLRCRERGVISRQRAESLFRLRAEDTATTKNWGKAECIAFWDAVRTIRTIRS